MIHKQCKHEQTVRLFVAFSTDRSVDLNFSNSNYQPKNDAQVIEDLGIQAIISLFCVGSQHALS